MKRFCYKVLCCGCYTEDQVLENISESETRIYPESERSRYFLRKNELIFFGNLRGISILTHEIPVDQKVMKIVCGKEHALFLLDNYELGSVGSNANGQLGVSLTVNFQDRPEFKKINFFNEEIKVKSHIIDIAAGDDFSMILLKNDKNEKFLFHLEVKKEEKFVDYEQERIRTVHQVHFEENIDIASIYAFGKRRALITFDNTIYFYGIDFSLNILKAYTKIYTFQSKIKMFSLGNDHCLILDQNDEVYSWGNNTFGELGIENSVFLDKPTKILFFHDIKVKKIGCGARHSVVLDHLGNLYTFGDNSDGQTIGNNSYNTIPQIYNNENKIKIIDFSVGYYHNFLLTNKGDTYCWGNSKDKKFGENYTVPFNTPRNFLKLKGESVKYVALGETISGKGNQVKLIEPQVPKQLKIMIVGDSGVGKSMLISSFISEGAPKMVEATHGVDILFKKIKIRDGNAAINFAIWDLSGKEEYLKIRTEFYGELFGLIYVFDHSKSTSFANIENLWMKEVKKNGGDKLVPCLIGNKSDLNKEIPQSSIDTFISKYKMNYFDVSAKTNENVKKAFVDFGTQLFETLISREQKKK